MLYYRAASTEDGHRRVGHGSLSGMMMRAGLTTREANVNIGETVDNREVAV